MASDSCGDLALAEHFAGGSKHASAGNELLDLVTLELHRAVTQTASPVCKEMDGKWSSEKPTVPAPLMASVVACSPVSACPRHCGYFTYYE